MFEDFQKDTLEIMRAGETFEKKINTVLATAIKGAKEIKDKTIVFSGGKGGVGKSFILAHLGLQLAARGKKVLYVDWDPLPKLKLGLTGTNGHSQETDTFKAHDKFSTIYTAFDTRTSAKDKKIINNEEDLLYAHLNSIFRPGSNTLEQKFKPADAILIDNSAGNELHETILSNLFNINMIVTTPEEPAMLDAASQIRAFAAQNKNHSQAFFLTFNSCLTEEEGKEKEKIKQSLLASNTEQAHKLNSLCQKFLQQYRPNSKLFYTVNVPKLPELAVQPYIKQPMSNVLELKSLTELLLMLLNKEVKNT